MSLEAFEKVSYPNLLVLYSLAKEGFENLSDIKLNYSRFNNDILENLNFLIEIKIFNLKNEKIFLEKDEGDFKRLLIDNIVRQNSLFITIKGYLQNYTLDDTNKYSFEPSNEYNLNTSDLRNFLISANYIKNENDKYYIIDEYILKSFENKKISPLELKQILEDKEKIGMAAEQVVFQNEVEKVKNININLKVDHVALRDVSAGYDILSYNVKKEKIFIEVKAVSSSNYKFYLSSNELNASKIYKDNYYLYLLPRDLSDPQKFNYKQIKIINNIHQNIFNNHDWIIENENFGIFLKK